jgi:hypothetical protein
MKKNLLSVIIIFYLFISQIFSQNKFDLNGDGSLDYGTIGFFDIRGNGIKEFINVKNHLPTGSPSLLGNLNFNLFWSSPAGAFGNCWDGAAGYFDNDILLDIAGYTFSPLRFYIYEQVSTKPDSFAIVFNYSKVEGGGFGPITFGDTDGDGKMEIICADFSTMSRIYIFEADSNNVYSSKETQTSLTHSNDGKTAQSLFIADLNKNGKKEIIIIRGDATGGGNVRIWEHNGVVGSHIYTNFFDYSTSTYLFGKGGIGDSDNDGYDEIFLPYGGIPAYNTYIRRIKYDSASASFIHQMYQSTAIGFPCAYGVGDLNNDGIKEMYFTGNSNNKASFYIFRNNGPNSYQALDSVFEPSDNNNVLSNSRKLLSGETYPSVLMGSFNGRVYIYNYNGTTYTKQYENLNYPGSAIRRVYWLPWNNPEGYFNTWSSANSNGTFYINKRQLPTGITHLETEVKDFQLYQNYPNPFNPSTKIKFILPLRRGVGGMITTLKIYNSIGQEIKTLLNKQLSPGTYEVTFNASNLPSGIYFYQLRADNYCETKKLILQK